MHIWHVPTHQRIHALLPVLDHQDPFQPFNNDTFGYHYIWLYKLFPQHHLNQHSRLHHECHRLLAICKRIFNMEHAAVTALQFWTADLEANILSSATE